MKLFWKYIFPPLYGLLVYFTVRLLADTGSGIKFWHRPIALNSIEIGTSMVMGYVFIGGFNRLFRYFDRQRVPGFSYRIILNELFYIFLFNLVVQNAVLTPMAALTDDGLSWEDFADINVIPLLYALIYYGVCRTNTFLQAYVENRLQLEKMMTDKLQTELKFLRAQYHPHFLFNALNTIYFQMDEDVKAAKKTVESFSELLRYQLYDQQQTVNISTEIQYIQNFIGLQQIRASRKLKLRVDFDSHLNGEQVYPLLFLPLVENAFKYVGGNFLIDMQMKREDQEIHFSVQNSIPPVANARTTGGIGLENLKRRLELLYPGRHSLITETRDDSYFAVLKLSLSNGAINDTLHHHG
ncbi:histidine kinase [Chitinophaga sp. 212800010-3]|uniref:sensor histidine kinase n=1 Tax=unclassified Chitinophaga TaxID=2619133 RepID=UPI002DF40DCA|nr:His-kinase domain-containing protein [Chitinophaga sp. 212800010-3]